MIRDRYLAAADAIERGFQRLAEIADERSPPASVTLLRTRDWNSGSTCDSSAIRVSMIGGTINSHAARISLVMSISVGTRPTGAETTTGAEASPRKLLFLPLAHHDDFEALLDEQRPRTFDEVERHGLLQQPAGILGTKVVSTMAGVEDHAPNTEAEGTRPQRRVSSDRSGADAGTRSTRASGAGAGAGAE
jgi:hypothetical protein